MNLNTRRCGCGFIVTLRTSCPMCAINRRNTLHNQGIAASEYNPNYNTAKKETQKIEPTKGNYKWDIAYADMQANPNTAKWKAHNKATGVIENHYWYFDGTKMCTNHGCNVGYIPFLATFLWTKVA